MNDLKMFMFIKRMNIVHVKIQILKIECVFSITEDNNYTIEFLTAIIYKWFLEEHFFYILIFIDLFYNIY